MIMIFRVYILSLAFLVFGSCKTEEEKYVISTYPKSGNIEQILISPPSMMLRGLSFDDENGYIKKSVTLSIDGSQEDVIEYYDTGLVQSKNSYINDSLHGESLYFYKSGQLRDRASYENGKKVGYVQYNRNGSKRSEVLLHKQNEYFKRVWTYDSDMNITKESTGIWPAILLENDIEDEKDLLTIEFSLPLNNEEFTNADFRLNYTINLLKEKAVVSSSNFGPIKFENGQFFHDFDLSKGLTEYEVDSLVIIRQVSYRGKKFEPSAIGATIN